MSTETIVLQHVLPNEIFLNVDGADGADGTSGEDGEDGRQGSDGEHGRSATNPTNGKDGDDLILTLKCRNQGDMVHVHAITTKGSVIWDQIYPLDNFLDRSTASVAFFTVIKNEEDKAFNSIIFRAFLYCCVCGTTL